MEYQYHILVERAKEGDRWAMEQLIEKMQPLIYSAITRYGRGYDREDLYQEACVILMESVYSYDPEKKVPFLAYLKSRIYYGIFNRTRYKVYHLSIDQPLEEGGTETLGDVLDDPEAMVEEKVLDGAQRDMLISALNQLSPKQRQVIELHYMWGMTLKDIAKARAVHYKGVLRLKERALKKLAEIIKYECIL